MSAVVLGYLTCGDLQYSFFLSFSFFSFYHYRYKLWLSLFRLLAYLLTRWQRFQFKIFAGWSVADYVKSIYLDLISSGWRKSINDSLCDVACDVHFLIWPGSNGIVSYPVALQFFLVFRWGDSLPPDVHRRWIERVTSYQPGSILWN